MRPKVVLLTNDFIAPTLMLCKRDERGDYDITAGEGKETF